MARGEEEGQEGGRRRRMEGGKGKCPAVSVSVTVTTPYKTFCLLH